MVSQMVCSAVAGKWTAIKKDVCVAKLNNSLAIASAGIFLKDIISLHSNACRSTTLKPAMEITMPTEKYIEVNQF